MYVRVRVRMRHNMCVFTALYHYAPMLCRVNVPKPSHHFRWTWWFQIAPGHAPPTVMQSQALHQHRCHYSGIRMSHTVCELQLLSVQASACQWPACPGHLHTPTPWLMQRAVVLQWPAAPCVCCMVHVPALWSSGGAMCRVWTGLAVYTRSNMLRLSDQLALQHPAHRLQQAGTTVFVFMDTAMLLGGCVPRHLQMSH